MALLALAAPRLITAAPLDLLATPHRPADPAEEPGANFPGSAFFFAQGAFDPVPGTPVARNAHVMGLAPVQAATATVFRGLTPLDSYRALNCLTSAIYYEAGNEPDDGQRAVAQVVLNRVRSGRWPGSVCGTVYQGSERTDLRCQFTFSCDGSMGRAIDMRRWNHTRRIAEQALSGRVYAPAGLATFYHTLAVRPGWANSMQPVAVIGAHIFYRSPGVEGTASAFRAAYLGRESQSGPSRPLWSPPVPMPDARPVPAFTLPETTPQPQSQSGADLPLSGVRPEYRNSGRPLI